MLWRVLLATPEVLPEPTSPPPTLLVNIWEVFHRLAALSWDAHWHRFTLLESPDHFRKLAFTSARTSATVKWKDAWVLLQRKDSKMKIWRRKAEKQEGGEDDVCGPGWAGGKRWQRGWVKKAMLDVRPCRYEGSKRVNVHRVEVKWDMRAPHKLFPREASAPLAV